MEATCLNCNTEIAQNFCANCGQKKYKRIDRKYIWDEVQYSTVHMNKGFFYSLKNTLKNPGKTARTFIDGNRVNHYKPIALAFILSGISAFIAYKMVGLGELTEKVNAMQTQDVEQLNVLKREIPTNVTVAEIRNAGHTPRKEAETETMDLLTNWLKSIPWLK